MARCLTSEEAVKQQRYYYHKAGAVALQSRDVVMVWTDRFLGKCKVKDRWEEGGFVVVKQLDDWPVYKVQCPHTGNQCNPTYRILHQNLLMLVPSNDDTASDTTQLLASAAIILNACMGTFVIEVEDGTCCFRGRSCTRVSHTILADLPRQWSDPTCMVEWWI